MQTWIIVLLLIVVVIFAFLAFTNVSFVLRDMFKDKSKVRLPPSSSLVLPPPPSDFDIKTLADEQGRFEGLAPSAGIAGEFEQSAMNGLGRVREAAIPEFTSYANN